MLFVKNDKPIWDDNYKVLTRPQLNINGLYVMGYANFQKAAETVLPHYHHTMEFMVVLKGRQQYTIGNASHTLHGGDILMTFPGEAHGYNELPQEVCEFIWFQLDFSAQRNFLDMKPPYCEYLFQQLKNYKRRLSHASQDDLRRLRQAFPLLGSDGLHNHLLGYNYFLGFVIKNLCTNETDASNISQDYSHDLSDALDYIHRHLLENPTLEEISRHCGLSVAKFNARFKEQTGVSPHTYITMLKIDTAKILLKNPEASITDVAHQLNFSSSNHFSSVFRKYTGETPSSFRQGSYF